MLDIQTRHRIDTARDILVGKVPDPKSQVEQITIALIYKFMDDMDAEAEELGGKRKFFASDFARYGWAKLMHSGLGGFETLNLYAEAITKMQENPGVPSLFREIFKNAYLPYRDPETLRAFLKVIDEFEYDHSERLGDAFEYLLSVLGSQGDAGQFRTPRHIIDFIVGIVDPKKQDRILDPACGTAGFLISSYKHILMANADAEGNSTLTPDEKGRLASNFRGYDISPDMVRLSLVNMYLHGFTDPHIFEYDTLTSQDRWNEYADVILANPPFMSPKGGIKPHNRFSVQSKRSEVLFVDYIIEHLAPNGRAGIIVPEGVIFQSQTAYTQLRKALVEDYLVAVISLPAGVFNPYSGVKTSVLVVDKSLAKQTRDVAFFKVENDGFNLGAQRRPIDKNDLPAVHSAVTEYLLDLRSHGSVGGDYHSALGLVVPKGKIAASGDYNLSGDRYRSSGKVRTAYPLVPLRNFMKSSVETIDPRKAPQEVFELWSIPSYDAGEPEVLTGCNIGSQKKVVFPGDVLLSRIIPHIRRACVVSVASGGRRQIASTEWMILSGGGEILPHFLRHMVVSNPFHARFMQTITGVGGSLSRANPGAVGEIQIPVPPLRVQEEIVAEVESYQTVIDGARTVLQHYQPHVPIHPSWPVLKIGELCDVERGASPRPIHDFITDSPDGVNWVKIGDAGIGAKYITQTKDRITAQGAAKSRRVHPGDLILSNSMSFGRPYIMTIDGCIHDGWLLLRVKSGDLDRDFLYYILRSTAVLQQFERSATGGVVNNLNSDLVRNVEISLPPIPTQRAIVSEMEADEALVNANQSLVARFEEKINAALGRIWGEFGATD